MWSRAERELLQILDDLVRKPAALTEIQSISDRLFARLVAEGKSLAKEPVPLGTFGKALPDVIRAGWVYVMRSPSETGTERHPNSRQRTMSLRGRGQFRLRIPGDYRICEHGRRVAPWDSLPMESDPTKPIDARWVSIPQNQWHQAVAAEGDWVMISFHTVTERDLIEEHPPG